MDYETGKNFEAIHEKLDIIIGWIASKEKKKETREEPKQKEEVKKLEKEKLKEYDIDDEEL